MKKYFVCFATAVTEFNNKQIYQFEKINSSVKPNEGHLSYEDAEKWIKENGGNNEEYTIVEVIKKY